MKKRNQLDLEFVDIQEVLDDLQIEYSTRGKNVSRGWIGTQCPFPGCDDRSNHCGICLSSPVVSCFACGKSGNYLSYLAAKLESWPKAIEIIQQHSPRELKKPREFIQRNKEVSKVELPKEASKNPSPYQKDYIERVRGYSLKELEALYDLYYCPPFGQWENKIIAPIYFKNQLVTFTSIDIALKANIRYLHLAEEKSIIHCKHLVYGYDQVVGDSVLVVEGFFDKVKLGTNCVSTMGTLVTKNQIKLLTKFAKVYLAFDGDKAGIIEGEKVANELASFVDVELLLLPEGSDPDKLSKDDVSYLRNLVKSGF